MDRIKEGDTVNIYFERCDAEHEVEILSTPQATGDCFTVKRANGTLVNVQNYSKIVKFP